MYSNFFKYTVSCRLAASSVGVELVSVRAEVWELIGWSSETWCIVPVIDQHGQQTSNKKNSVACVNILFL
jgi:hypothetical protein